MSENISKILQEFEMLPYSTPMRSDGLSALVCGSCKEDRFVCKRCASDWLRTTLEDFEKVIRFEIAKEAAQAGINSIPLLHSPSTFTGNFWISLNMFYFLMTGRHMNKDCEQGIIPRNRAIDAIIEEADKKK